MRVKIQGLSQPSEGIRLIQGLYRARVVRFDPARRAAKPYRAATFLILEPPDFAGRHVRTRLYCHERAVWKLRWFLSDFGYDSELLAAGELDDRSVLGLEGVIRLAFWGKPGRQLLDVQGFAPAKRWVELSSRQAPSAPAAERATA